MGGRFSRYIQIGNKSRAFDILQMLLESHSFLEARYNYALLLSEKSNKDEAKRQMEIVVRDGESLPHYKYKTEKKWIRKAKAFLAIH